MVKKKKIKKIKFNKKFYTLRAIKKAVRAYQKLADFDFKEDKKSIKVTMKNIDQDVENIIEDEFSNYVLATMKNGSFT